MLMLMLLSTKPMTMMMVMALLLVLEYPTCSMRQSSVRRRRVGKSTNPTSCGFEIFYNKTKIRISESNRAQPIKKLLIRPTKRKKKINKKCTFLVVGVRSFEELPTLLSSCFHQRDLRGTG